MEVQSLAMLANMLGHKFNVDVRAVGNEAYCMHEANGHTVITVPAFIADTDADRVYVRGYIDHEIGHVRFTDWSFDKFTGSDTALKKIMNILEDVYVEKMMGKCYPGCALNLSALQRQLFVHDMTMEKVPAPREGDAAIMWSFFRYLLYKVRGILDFIVSARQSFELRAPGIADKLDALLDERLPKCNSTKDNYELAKDIQNLLYFELVEQSESDAKASSKLGASDPNRMKKAQTAEEKQFAANCMAHNGREFSKEADSFIINDMERVLDGARNKLNKSNDSARMNGSIRGGAPNDLTASQKAVTKVPIKIKNMAMGCAAALSAQLQSLMQAKVLRKVRTGMSGKLDTRRLHRVSINNPNVFLRNNETRQVNTQVILLGDTSGSMDGMRDLASASMYAVMSALRNIHGVRSAAFGFGDNSLSVMCDFDEPLYSSDMYIYRPNGGTPGGTALQRAVQKFDMTKTEQRKILFLITDGDFPQQQVVTFNAVYKEAQEVGIDVIGIGIGTDAVKNLWKPGDFFYIKNIKELAPKLFEILKTRMV